MTRAADVPTVPTGQAAVGTAESGGIPACPDCPERPEAASRERIRKSVAAGLRSWLAALPLLSQSETPATKPEGEPMPAPPPTTDAGVLAELRATALRCPPSWSHSEPHRPSEGAWCSCCGGGGGGGGGQGGGGGWLEWA